MFDLEIAGEFLVMAATLMYVKSRELLPKDQQAQTGQEEEEEDPRWELIRQLVEYKKFKDAAVQLQIREIEQERVFPRLPSMPPPPAQTSKSEATLFDLINAINGVLKRVMPREDLRDIFEDKWTVSSRIEYLIQLTSERAVVKFSDLFLSATSRSEVVCTFLALLELVRLKQLVCLQAQDFGEIEIRRAPAAPSQNGAADANGAERQIEGAP
jgi:segregation and condensation protein A